MLNRTFYSQDLVFQLNHVRISKNKKQKTPEFNQQKGEEGRWILFFETIFIKVETEESETVLAFHGKKDTTKTLNLAKE